MLLASRGIGRGCPGSFYFPHNCCSFFLDDIILFLETSLGFDLLIIGSICLVSLLFQKPQLFFWIWLSDQRSCPLDDLEPSPVSQAHVLSEVPLAHHKKFTLISPLEIVHIANALQNLSL